MNGHAVMWQNDNIKNYPYLLLNSMTDDSGAPVANGPIGYTKSPEIPPAMAALLQIVDADMQAILGNQEAGEELQANLSGVAVELVQQKLDMQTYIYISNMAKAIKRGGEIWLGMAKEIYVEENRKKKTIDESGEVSSATLMQQNVDPDTGMPALTNDLSEADFDVTATPGPTSQSKRASTVRSLIALLGATQDPETMQVITSMIMMNMEGEGIDEIHDYFRTKLVRMGVIKPTPEEQQQMQQEQAQAAQQPPSPNDQFLQASAEQAKADAQLKQANTVNVAAQAELNKAKAMQILADIKAGNIDQAFKAIEAMQNNAMGQSEQQNAAAVTAANVDNTNAQTLNTHADTMHKHAQIAHTRAQVAHTHAQVAHTHANIANTDAQTTNTEAQTNAINNPEPEAAQ
jgi:hypothetical protein